MKEYLPFVSVFISSAGFIITGGTLIFYLGRNKEKIENIEKTAAKNELEIDKIRIKIDQTIEKYEKKVEERRKDYKDSIKRIHERIENLNCVPEAECRNKYNNFETRISNYHDIYCSQLDEVKKNQNQSDMKIALILEQMQGLKESIENLRNK